eukprot:TRINITY_DN1928_c0_g1_i4.p2 TRINITY_DN1928_c0_g1~~TRINITY_DN1928_c0_g1_i4.p2  ORF type:complete len:259 (+),score=40.03 TRINITY_DN1928_c0_g1_i4:968-1744(+)
MKQCAMLIAMAKPKEEVQFDFSILLSMKKAESEVTRKLMEVIETAFTKVRHALQHCSKHYHQVSSVMAHNSALTSTLLEFERTCAIGTRLLKNPDPLVDFTLMMKRVLGAHKEVKEKIRNGSAEMFCAIPWLVVVSSFGKESKDLYNFHYPLEMETEKDQWLYALTKEKYKKLCGEIKELRSLLEAEFIGGAISYEILASPGVKEMIKSIKELGSRISRCEPTSWNDFLLIALSLVVPFPCPSAVLIIAIKPVFILYH